MDVKYPHISLIANDIICVQGGRPLFKPLSFTLGNGQILLLQGSNGVGKTTCLRALAGLSSPERGSLEWQNKPLKPYSNSYLPHMIYIGHHAGIKLALTPEENIEQSLCLAGHKATSEKIRMALEQVGLKKHIHVACARLSAGQQRRVNWARLMLMQVPLWILDEPLTALDQDAVQGLQQCLTSHQQKGGSAIVTSHQHLPVATQTITLEPWA